ncbi:MAG: hypothetical protein JSW55_18520 [Chloroflexota bacterium]|nr:MAG: hypothetical protein JSW55_18520 [Chloroflexota bacterium]
MPRFDLLLLGDVQLVVDDRPVEINSRKGLALLAYLGVSDQHHDRESLAALLWPEFNQTRARANLRRTLWVLNQTPLADFVDAGPESINLRADDGIRVDAVHLRERIVAWREAKVGTLDDKLATELAEITAVYRDQFLADLYLADSNEFEDWALVQRERFRRDVLDALHALADYCLDLGDFETAQLHAWRQLEIDNLREGAYRQLMTALAQSGQRIAALAQYERLRELLEGELEVEPSAETTELYEQIRADSIPAESGPSQPQVERPAEAVQNGPMPVFLFTDIEDSTPLWDRHREAMLGALLQHNRILNEKIEGYGGRILESRGDGVKALFEGGKPLESALAIQKTFGAADWGEIGELRIRVGLHGAQEDWEGYDYFREGDAFFGPLLNYAARVMDAAWGGQILVSESVKDAFPLPDGASWQPYGEHELKGCEEPIHIYGLSHPELPHQSFPPPRTLSSSAVLAPGQSSPSDQADLEEAEVTALTSANPYRGLFSFREEDAPFFFGRESFTDLLMTTVREQSMLAVVGPSGSGKSSVVHAGLLSQLRQQGNWLITSFRPGSRPFHALAGALIPHLEPDLSKTDQMVQINKLAEALKNGDLALIDVVNNILQDQPPETRLPLVGDQFEELYTLVPENELRDHFMDVLTDAVYEQQYRPAPFFSFILTLRADFMGQALAHRPFADALQETDVILGPMTQGELSRAIVSPANKLAVDFETGLVARILDDVGAEPGNLPLLEFAMAMLWERQDSALLTHDAYEAIGRVDGALARHADAVLDELSANQQETAQRIFIQVVRPGEGTEDTRRLATRAELGEADWQLVQHLADSRLLVTGRDAEGNETVEVVHEALIRGWGRLRGWMEADRDFRVWQERLRAVIRQWKASERDDGALLRGVALATAERWLVERPADLSLSEVEFIQASITSREQRQADRERRQMERDRLRRRVTAGLAIGLVVAITLAILAAVQWNTARQAQQAAEAEALARAEQQALAERSAAESLSLALAANALQAQESGNGDLALALALEATAIENPPLEAERAVRETTFGPGTRLLLAGHESPVSALALLPGDQRVLSGSGRLQPFLALADGEPAPDNSLRLWDLENGHEIHHFEGHTDTVNEIAITQDGATAVSASADGNLIVWDLENGGERLRFEGHHEPVFRLFLTPDDDKVVSLSGLADEQDVPSKSTLIVWDIETGQELHRLETEGEHIRHIDLSPDGRVVFLGLSEFSTESTLVGQADLILWDVEKGEEIRRVDFERGDGTGVWNLVISPDGETGLALIVDLGPDGQRGPDDSFFGLLVDMDSGQVRHRFDLDIGLDYPMFTPDGEQIVVNAEEVAVLDAETGTEIRRFGATGGGHTAGISFKDLSPDGRTLLTAGNEGTLLWWNLATGSLLQLMTGHQAALSRVLFLADGRGAVTASDDGTLRVWNLSRGESTEATDTSRRFENHDGDNVNHVAISPDGQTVVSTATSSEDQEDDRAQALAWALQTGDVSFEFIELDAVFLSVAISPDGRFALLGGASVTNQDTVDPTLIVLWDLETGEEVRRFEVPEGGAVWHLAISEDGRKALSGTEDGILRLWDLESGQVLQAMEDPGAMTIFAVAFTPDGGAALSGSDSGNITLWDLETGREIKRYEHGGFVVNIAFSPDGKQFASTSTDLSIVLWDFESGEVIRRFVGHDNGVSSAAFTPDGSQLISSSADGTLILWDVETGEQLRRFTEHEAWVWKVILTPDGRTAISSGEDGRVIVRPIANLNLEEVIDHARANRYIPDLTCDQRAQYHLEPCDASG